jgi:predicted PurR-regulated permease PerM
MTDTLHGATARTAAVWGAAVLLLTAVVALVVALCFALRAAVVPVLLALLISTLLDPLHRRLRRWGLPAGLSAGLSCAVLVGVVGGTVWTLVSTITDAASGIGASLTEASGRASGNGTGAQALHEAVQGVKGLGGKVTADLAKGVLSGLGLAAQLLAGAVLTVAMAFFLLRDREQAVGSLRGILPEGQRDRLLRMANRAYGAMSGFMRGTTIIAAIDAVFITLGLLLLGVPRAASLGALVFVGAYVPYIGAFLSGLVAVLVAFGDGGLALAAGTLLVVLGVQVIEGNVLQPVIQSRTVSLHPAFVLLAVTAGGAVGGLLGTLLAVPLTAAAFGVLDELRKDRAEAAVP